MQNRSSRKKTRDVNQLTRLIVGLCTGNPITEDISPIADKERYPAPVELGGLKGHKAKADKPTSEKRS